MSRIDLAAARRTSMAGGRSVSWLLELRATERPGATWMVWEPFDGAPRTWTYAEFAADVERAASGLARRGVGAGDRVVIHLDNCPEFLIAWFACARLGAIAVCTNTKSTADEMTYFAAHSGARAAITQPRFTGIVAEAMPSADWVAVTDSDAGEPPAAGTTSGDDSWSKLLVDGAAPPGAVADPLAPAWIQYTSGTTSRPKAVTLTHANALWGAKVNATHEGLTAADVHLVHLPLFHINALSYSTMATLWAGGTIVVVPRFSTSRFWDVAVRNRCTWAGMIPFAMRALAGGEIPKHSFRAWGAGWCAPPDDEIFGLRVLGWYGMTETVSHPIMDDLGTPGHPGAMGRPTPEYQVAVLDDDGQPVEPGATGGLFVRGVPGVSLFGGYLHDEQATAEAVDPDGWLRTGDRATVLDDGFLAFTDRSKDMLKVGGENVAASEVERVIMAVAGVSEVAVVGRRHPMLDEVPVAFVLPDGDRPGIADDVMAACKHSLASFKVPAEVRVVAELPRSTLNKIAKGELRTLVDQETGGGPQ